MAPHQSHLWAGNQTGNQLNPLPVGWNLCRHSENMQTPNRKVSWSTRGTNPGPSCSEVTILHDHAHKFSKMNEKILYKFPILLSTLEYYINFWKNLSRIHHRGQDCVYLLLSGVIIPVLNRCTRMSSPHIILWNMPLLQSLFLSLVHHLVPYPQIKSL